MLGNTAGNTVLTRRFFPVAPDPATGVPTKLSEWSCEAESRADARRQAQAAGIPFLAAMMTEEQLEAAKGEHFARLKALRDRKNRPRRYRQHHRSPDDHAA